MSVFNKRGADRLAYAVARCVMSGALDARSGPADALLDYLEIGTSEGCNSVPDWMKKYEESTHLKPCGWNPSQLVSQAAAVQTEPNGSKSE